MKSVLSLCALLALSACRGADGVDGINGVDGVNGVDGTNGVDGVDGSDATTYFIEGVINDGTGPVGAGYVVTADYVMDDGQVFATAGATQTDANGAFSIAANQGVVASARLVVRAMVGDRTLATPVVDVAAANVSPSTTAVAELVLAITRTEGGRSIDDYTITELTDALTKADTALSTAGTTLTDLDAVRLQVLKSVGSLIAEYSEGPDEATPNVIQFGADAPFCFETVLCTEGDPVSAWHDADISGYSLTTGTGYVLDFDMYGSVNDGWNQGFNDGFDTSNQLSIDDTPFGAAFGVPVRLEDATTPPPINDSSWLPTDRAAGMEIVYGPDIDTYTNLTATRKVWADPVGGWYRITDIITNTSGAPITTDVMMVTEVGADQDTQLLSTSSGDRSADATDRWFASAGDRSDPVVAQWIGDVDWFTQDPAPDKDIYSWGWDAVAFDTDQTRTFISFGQLLDNPTDVGMISADLAMVEGTAALYTGMSEDDALAAYNTSFTAGWRGEAGAVAPTEELTILDTTTGASFSGVASSDGSFFIPLAAQTGDALTLTGSFGTTAATTLP